MLLFVFFMVMTVLINSTLSSDPNRVSFYKFIKLNVQMHS